MKKILGLIFNRWVLGAVLLLALAMLIWLVGPLVAIAEARPLESENARWIFSVLGLASFSTGTQSASISASRNPPFVFESPSEAELPSCIVSSRNAEIMPPDDFRLNS